MRLARLEGSLLMVTELALSNADVCLLTDRQALIRLAYGRRRTLLSHRSLLELIDYSLHLATR